MLENGKFLDERIKITISNITVTESGTYVYRIVDDLPVHNNQPLFYGNAYLSSGQTAVTFDITDIVRNEKWTPTDDELETTGATAVKTICRYGVLLNIGNQAYNGWSDNVVHGYRYPNRKIYLGYNAADVSVWFNPADPEDNLAGEMMQQVDENRPDLIPHYPIGINFNYRGTFEISPNADNLDFRITGGGHKEFSVPVTSEMNNTYGLFYNQSVNDVTNGADNPEVELNAYILLRFEADGDTWVTESAITSWNFTGSSVSIGAADLLGAFSYFNRDINFQTRVTREQLNQIKNGNLRIGICLENNPAAPPTASVIFKPNFGDIDLDKVTRIGVSYRMDKEEINGIVIDYRLTFNSFRVFLNNSDEPMELGYKYNSGEDEYVPCAIFDTCPARYYLQWQDRYGSFQCQPFTNKVRFTETYERVETIDYADNRHLATINVQPKWEINSGWIEEKLYPYYESIFISPVLVLYDTYEMESYRVMVTGDYVEKTYQNEKKMINISLTLEENKTQNIIY